MKFNQWTLGLAAVGVISLASAARADEGAVPLLTAVSPRQLAVMWTRQCSGTSARETSISRCTSSAARRRLTVQPERSPTLDRQAMDETEWLRATSDLWFGPDADVLARDAKRVWWVFGCPQLCHPQAYVALRVPVGTDRLQSRAFDSIIGTNPSSRGTTPT